MPKEVSRTRYNGQEHVVRIRLLGLSGRPTLKNEDRQDNGRQTDGIDHIASLVAQSDDSLVGGHRPQSVVRRGHVVQWFRRVVRIKQLIEERSMLKAFSSSFRSSPYLVPRSEDCLDIGHHRILYPFAYNHFHIDVHFHNRYSCQTSHRHWVFGHDHRGPAIVNRGA